MDNINKSKKMMSAKIFRLMGYRESKDMKELERRILKGLKSIIEARTRGKDVTDWEKHLFDLIRRLIEQSKTVKVKMGQFGFCDCLLKTHGLCTGCWTIPEFCVCRVIEVDPKEEVTAAYARFLKKINTPLRH